MSIDDNEKRKGFFVRLRDFFKGFEGSGCACNCLKNVWEKQAQELAKKDKQDKSGVQES